MNGHGDRAVVAEEMESVFLVVPQVLPRRSRPEARSDGAPVVVLKDKETELIPLDLVRKARMLGQNPQAAIRAPRGLVKDAPIDSGDATAISADVAPTVAFDFDHLNVVTIPSWGTGALRDDDTLVGCLQHRRRVVP